MLTRQGAPELHKGWQVSAEAHQTIDVWSLGCVFSVTATWVALGYEGIKQYRRLRSQAILKRVDEQKKLQSNTGPKLDDGDYFHNGIGVLQEVTDWHKYLRAVLRRSDKSTTNFLDLVDKHMLIGSPEERSKSCDLCKKLDIIRADPEPFDTPVPESILTFLKDLAEGISDELTSSTISYESLLRKLPLYSTYKDRQTQISKYRDGPLIPTTLPSQRRLRIAYESVLRKLPLYSTYKDRQKQKSKYHNAPLITTTLPSQRNPTKIASRVTASFSKFTIEKESSPYGLSTKFDNLERAPHDPVSPNNEMQRRRISTNSLPAGRIYPTETIDYVRAMMDAQKWKRGLFHIPNHLSHRSKKDEFLARHYFMRDVVSDFALGGVLK